MSKSQRDKGKRGEREAAQLLQQVWPAACRSYHQSRSGRDAPDIDGTPFWVEVKRGKRPNVRRAMAQAAAESDGRPPLVMTREDGGEWLVTMRAADWIASRG